MINSDLNVGGIHRAFIVTVGGDIRIYIPGLTSLIAGSNAPVNEDGTINIEKYKKNLKKALVMKFGIKYLK